ncbi:MAG: S8 family serine peptidase [Clostridium sp.]|nr:S8 family serine peptidase [Clostridium sp.]
MFSIKKKLHPALKYALDNDDFKTYRVLIHCNSLLNRVEKKLKIQKNCFICTIPELDCICAVISARTILRLAELPEINFITFDEIAEICASKTSCKKNTAPQPPNVSVNYCPKKICIGIIDTGAFPNDDLLRPSTRIAKFVDLINGFKYPYDDNGHGTFMCGLIAGNGYSSNGLYKGICKNSNLYCIKAFNGIGKAFISSILFAVHNLLDNSIEFNIRVICMPFEIYSQDKFILSLFHKLFNLIYEKNITLVVSSGSNENFKNSIRGFATFDNCITVAGVDTSTHSIESYNYSSCGPCSKHSKPDLCAPCVNLCSLNCDTNYISERNGAKLYPHKLKEIYTTYTGTSCSAAYISGICALLLEKDATLKPKDIVSLLKASCNMLNLPKWQQGSGLIDFKSLFEK